MTVPTWATWSRKGDCYENIRKSHGNLLEEVYRQRKSRDLEAFTTDSEYQLSPLIKFVTFCVIILNIQWFSFLIYKIRIIIIVLISWDYCVLNTYGTALIKCYLKTKVGRKSKLGLRKDWKAVWNAGAISLSQLHFILPVITDKMSLLPIAHEKKWLVYSHVPCIYLSSENDGFCLSFCSKFWERPQWLTQCRYNQLQPELIKSHWAHKQKKQVFRNPSLS